MSYRIRRGSLAYFLLLALERSIETGTSVSDFLASPSTFVWTGYRTNLNYNNFYKAIRQLREKGYLETPKDGRKILLKLTDKGKQELILKKLLEDKNWDGKWRIVIFDIPEKHRKIRNVFRNQLRLWQFEQLQKSVWVGKKDVAQEIQKFVKDLNISDWVKIFEANKV
jgi:phenylacetic acid degradation operon negative regulatory protein